MDIHGHGSEVYFFEEDCYKIELDKIRELPGGEKFMIYFFDGPHEVMDHYLAVVNFFPILEDLSILIIDDWNLAEVQSGTDAALEQLPVDVLYKLEITSEFHTTKQESTSYTGYHNGCCIFVLKKH